MGEYGGVYLYIVIGQDGVFIYLFIIMGTDGSSFIFIIIVE
jgi:hypothetical protein